MKKLFNNILIPVNFSAPFHEVINKAVDIAKLYQCEIYLLHVNAAPFFSSKNITAANNSGEQNVPGHVEPGIEPNHFSKYIMELTGETIPVKNVFLTGAWHKAIDDCIIQNKIDLVLIGANAFIGGKRKLNLNPDKIAAAANIPVVIVPEDRKLVGLHSIVIPVTDFLPVRKLIYAVYLAKEYHSTIILLGIMNGITEDKVRYYVKRSQELILDMDDFAIETVFVNGENVAKEVYDFAIQKFVDLVILNPGAQTMMPGLFSSLRGNRIQKYSIPPVLAVNTLPGFYEMV
ncbi:MAG: universal stress protein [Bacteroidetes bacterium]|nr:universal stress protein [Bacteroidota bacterium]